MESNTTQATQSALYNFLGWADVNKKRIATFLAAIAIVGIVAAFFVWRSGQREAEASEALSELRAVQIAPNVQAVPASEYLRVAEANANTVAGTRALLMCAGALFNEGKFAEAFQQFDRFTKEHSESAMRPEATLGAAASLDAQGKIPEATASYKEVMDRFPNSPSATQAKFAIARLYEAQNKPDLAIKLYMELGRDENLGSISLRSQVRVADIVQKNPALRPTSAAPQKLQ